MNSIKFNISTDKKKYFELTFNEELNQIGYYDNASVYFNENFNRKKIVSNISFFEIITDFDGKIAQDDINCLDEKSAGLVYNISRNNLIRNGHVINEYIGSLGIWMYDILVFYYKSDNKIVIEICNSYDYTYDEFGANFEKWLKNEFWYKKFTLEEKQLIEWKATLKEIKEKANNIFNF